MQGSPVQRIGLRRVPTQQLGLQKPQRMKDKLFTPNLWNLLDQEVRNELVLVKLVDSEALKNLTLVVTLVVSGIWDF